MEQKRRHLKQIPAAYLFENPLPRVAQEVLKTAASIEPWLPKGESAARRKALDDAREIIRRRFPQYFRN